MSIAPVRRQLRGIDEHPSAVTVRDRGDVGIGQQLAGDVAGSGDRHQHAGAVSDRSSASSNTSATADGRRRGREVHVVVAAPRQQVGVVLEVERHDRGVVGEGARPAG